MQLRREKAEGKGQTGSMSLSNAVRAYERIRIAKRRKMRREIECQKTRRSWTEEMEARIIEEKKAELTKIERELAVVAIAEKMAQMNQKNEADYTTEEKELKEAILGKQRESVEAAKAQRAEILAYVRAREEAEQNDQEGSGRVPSVATEPETRRANDTGTENAGDDYPDAEGGKEVEIIDDKEYGTTRRTHQGADNQVYGGAGNERKERPQRVTRAEGKPGGGETKTTEARQLEESNRRPSRQAQRLMWRPDADAGPGQSRTVKEEWARRGKGSWELKQRSPREDEPMEQSRWQERAASSGESASEKDPGQAPDPADEGSATSTAGSEDVPGDTEEKMPLDDKTTPRTTTEAADHEKVPPPPGDRRPESKQ